MALLSIKIYVSSVDDVLALYDVIQVQRTKVAPPNDEPEDLTAETSEPAELAGTLEGPYLINGYTLTFKVNGTEVTATFTAPNPVAIPDVVDNVNTAITNAGLPAVASDDGTGRLQIATTGSGTNHTIEIISGTAMSALGFQAGDKAGGKAAHITVQTGVDEYTFQDGDGEASYYYRTRFLNTVDGTYSAWSDWIQGSTGSVVDSANLIIAKVKLAGLDGRVLADKKIAIVNVFNPLKVDGYGVFGDSIVLETDGLGEAETPLVKGAVVDVVFSGTSIIRRITVPSTGTEFDLLDESLVTYDAFGIQDAAVPYAPRRS